MPGNSGIYNPATQYIVLLENKQLYLATLTGFSKAKHYDNYPHDYSRGRDVQVLGTQKTTFLPKL
ncbi:hypothetical protein NIES3585_17860 [Nodularia sp. NIES-3585]|nr:hypothetical protein NIES3585_17860 [Nodularia sp. NIES-3585]